MSGISFIGGSARIGVYAAQGNARTFDCVSPLLPSKSSGVIHRKGETTIKLL